MASTIKVNNIQNQCGANIINESANTITIGASGDTITLACGASQTGFGRTGTVDWDTTAKTASFTAVSGNGYFVNTTSGAITVTLPATPSAGDIVSIADYTNTFQTNNVTVGRNGSNIGGVAANAFLSTEGQSVTFIYVDGTEGWKNVQDSTSNVVGNPNIEATGGTITTCGDYKIHTFTGPGTFTVTNSSSTPANNIVSYLVVAGGAAGGTNLGGGGGAGGFREYKGPADCYTASPLNGNPGGTAITITATGYPITVGGGGAGAPCTTPTPRSSSGSNSVFSTITSTGGGGSGGGNNCGSPLRPGLPGGSGGGAAWGDDAYNPPMVNPPSGVAAGGTGNTPPTSPSQGNDGGASGIGCYAYGGGGGGAGAVGFSHPTNLVGGLSSGGIGSYVSSCFAGCNGEPGPVCGARYFAGGGGGRPRSACTSVGGIGGGGDYGSSTPTGNAVANTGGGGGAIYPNPGGAGGKGIVIIRYKYQ